MSLTLDSGCMVSYNLLPSMNLKIFCVILKKHSQFHLNERVYKWQYCNRKQFTWKNNEFESLFESSSNN